MFCRQKTFGDPSTSFPDGKSLEQRFMERKAAREAARSVEVGEPSKKGGKKDKDPWWLLLLENEDEVDEKEKKRKDDEGSDGDFEGDWDKDGGRLYSRNEIKIKEGSKRRWAQTHKRRQSEGDSVIERWKPSGKWSTREQPNNWRSREKRENSWSFGQSGWQPSSPIFPTNSGGRRFSWAHREDRSRVYESKAFHNDWRAREDEQESEFLDTHGYCDIESTHYIQNTLSAMAHSYNHPRIPTFLSEILELINDSLGGHTLKFVVDTMFKIAPTTEDHVTGKLSLQVYVEFSLSLAKSISPNIADKSIKDGTGCALSGSNLLKVYILGKCSSLVRKEWHFIRTTVPRMPLFFGELYRHDLCPDTVVISCVKEHLAHGKPPEIDSIRTLCELLEMTGKKLYKWNKTRAVVDEALDYIRELASEENTDSAVRLVLLEILGQRELW
ncbi:hypothetical protein L873DRAFT_460648 [Choiromyces venosus 120613-1]|uniref:MIF4G domain-containing protein n=1 Tax=Choiromyces venosus 120613-1 TaxID=1336337 RepID=A0A3N4JW28_9PEZI|nr:hypothetical protein L873DRAFT_460648 [Choiromyces venosus 120613-1]